MEYGPTLDVLHRPPLDGLTKSQKEERRHYITATDAAKIMSGQWPDLWDEKINGTELIPSLPMLIGTHLEELHRYWFGVETNYAVGYDPSDPLLQWADDPLFRAHIDGMLIGINAEEEEVVLRPWEGKCVNPFSKMDALIERYYPQLQHIMLVTGHSDIEFSVIFLNNRLEHVTIERDNEYLQTYVKQARRFWRYVIDREQPPIVEEQGKVPHEDKKIRRITLADSPEFLALGSIWAKNQKPAKAFADATKKIKELVPQDALVAYSDDIYVSVGTNGAKTIRALSARKKEELDKEVDRG